MVTMTSTSLPQGRYRVTLGASSFRDLAEGLYELIDCTALILSDLGSDPQEGRKRRRARYEDILGEVARRAGVPVATVKHYLREKLLPPATKTHRNMAYYPPEAVERMLADGRPDLPRAQALPLPPLELDPVAVRSGGSRRVGDLVFVAKTRANRHGDDHPRS